MQPTKHKNSLFIFLQLIKQTKSSPRLFTTTLASLSSSSQVVDSQEEASHKLFIQVTTQKWLSIDFTKHIANEPALFTSLLEKLQVHDAQLAHKFCGYLLSTLMKANKFDLVHSVYTMLLQGRVQPNVYILNIMINCACKQGRLEDGTMVIRHMETQWGCTPDSISYNTLISGYCKAGQISKVFELFDEMSQKNVKPDSFTYSSLIHSLCKVGKLEEALKLHERIVGSGFESTRVIYSCLMSGLFKAHRLREASLMFDRMLEKGLKPDIVTYNIMVDAFCKHGELEEAFRVYSMMKAQGIAPDLVTYNSLLHGLWKEKMADKAISLYQWVEKGLVLDSIVYATMIDGYWKCGYENEAWKLYAEMKDKGMKPYIFVYNSLLHLMCSKGDMKGAGWLLQEMRGFALKPDVVSYNILIAGYYKISRVDRAYMLYSEMLERGMRPTSLTFYVLILVSFKSGKLGKALEFINEIVRRDVPLGDNVIVGIVKGFCRIVKNMGQVLELLRMMVDKEMVCNHVTYSILVVGYCQLGNLSYAIMYFQDMQINGWTPHRYVCSVLVDSLIEQGEVHEARNLLEGMKGTLHLSYPSLPETSQE